MKEHDEIISHFTCSRISRLRVLFSLIVVLIFNICFIYSPLASLFLRSQSVSGHLVRARVKGTRIETLCLTLDGASESTLDSYPSITPR